MPPKRGVCRGCQRERQIHGFGLCRRCRVNPYMVAKYGKVVIDLREPESMEEVEALIAQQMLCLPRWWNLSADRQDDHGPKRAGIRVVKQRMNRKELTA